MAYLVQSTPTESPLAAAAYAHWPGADGLALTDEGEAPGLWTVVVPGFPEPSEINISTTTIAIRPTTPAPVSGFTAGLRPPVGRFTQ